MDDAWLAGYGMAKARSLGRVHVVAFAAVVSLAIYLIADIEYPRFGLVTLDDAHEVLVEVQRQIAE